MERNQAPALAPAPERPSRPARPGAGLFGLPQRERVAPTVQALPPESAR